MDGSRTSSVPSSNLPLTVQIPAIPAADFRLASPPRLHFRVVRNLRTDLLAARATERFETRARSFPARFSSRNTLKRASGTTKIKANRQRAKENPSFSVINCDKAVPAGDTTRTQLDVSTRRVRNFRTLSLVRISFVKLLTGPRWESACLRPTTCADDAILASSKANRSGWNFRWKSDANCFTNLIGRATYVLRRGSESREFIDLQTLARPADSVVE